MASQQSWYQKRVSGPPLQRLWQTAVGGAIFIVFVGVPMTQSMVKTQSIKKARREGTLINPIQQRVYDQRMALRTGLMTTTGKK